MKIFGNVNYDNYDNIWFINYCSYDNIWFINYCNYDNIWERKLL